MTTVLFYDRSGTCVVGVRAYRTHDLAWAALRRAAARGQIAAFGHTRTAMDPPTTHH
jgi:hypothetical protein